MNRKEKILNLIYKIQCKLTTKFRLKIYLKTHYPRILKFVETATSFLDKYDVVKNGKHSVSIYERIFCLAKNLSDRPKCKICNANTVTGFDIVNNTYKKWCSPHCQASDPECIKKSKACRKDKYGDENFVGIEKSRQTRFKNNNGKWHSSDFANKCKCGKIKNGHDENWNNPEKAKQTISNKLKENPNFWNDRELKTKQTKIKNGHDENWNNREKFKNTVSSFSNEHKLEIKIKRESTNLKNIGVKYPLQNDNIKKQVQQTLIDTYGVSCSLQIDYVHEAAILNKKEIAWNRIFLDLKNYIPLFSKEDFLANRDEKKYWDWKCCKCGQIFKSRYDNGHHTICRICYPIDHSTSKDENQIFNMIKTYCPDAIHNDRIILNGKELDIYIPSKHIAFEYDGLYWHSDINKPNNYHINKTNTCQKLGIQLIHIFENEWINKQYIVESRIKNLIGIYDKTLFARNCLVKNIDSQTSINFQNENHIQGAINSKINIGLFYNDNLISLMTFSKPRFNKKYEWELLRFCTKLGYHIPGAAGKLLKYFEKTYNPKSLISYADRRWSQGKLYKVLGFMLDHISQPNYWYIDLHSKHIDILNRINFQKHKLKNILKTYDKTKTEIENMSNNGYTRIFDCGNYVFVKTY